MTLQVAIKALRDDAAIWTDVASTTSRAASAVAGLTLGESQLSWAGNPTGLRDTYEAIRAKVGMLLDEATTTFTALSNALNEVATAYETSDEVASTRLRGVWDARQ